MEYYLVNTTQTCLDRFSPPYVDCHDIGSIRNVGKWPFVWLKELYAYVRDTQMSCTCTFYRVALWSVSPINVIIIWNASINIGF